MLNLALIVGSTRPNRFADHLVKWIVEGAAARSDLSLDVLDLRDHPLPFYNEPAPVAYTGGKYSEAAAGAWAQGLARFDGYIATVAEYNHGPTAALKNAFDSAFYEWQRKPVAFAGYGNSGGARAIEQMRSVAIELQMAPIKHDVNIGREPYLGVLREGKSFNDFDYLVQARTAVFDNLVWWGNALKAARAEPLRQAS